VSEPRFHIVLVEDTEPDVFLIREALERDGLEFELEVLDDGEKAVDFIDRIDQDPAIRRPNLLLLDLNLPKKSGGQVLERVRQSPAWADVPVVILTSSDSPMDKARAAQYKATEYFKKPSKWDEFMRLGPLVRDLLVEGAAH
jgi:DNA-binding response OmpR family regulator